MHAPLSGTKIRTIRKAVKKRQALYLIWTSAVIAHVYAAIYAGKNGPYFKAVTGSYMGHIWEHQWGIHGRIYGPYGGSNGACLRAYIGHIWGHTWGMHTRIHGHIWDQPYRESREEGNSRELPRAYPFPSLPLPPGKGREGKIIPTLFRSVYRRILPIALKIV